MDDDTRYEVSIIAGAVRKLAKGETPSHANFGEFAADLSKTFHSTEAAEELKEMFLYGSKELHGAVSQFVRTAAQNQKDMDAVLTLLDGGRLDRLRSVVAEKKELRTRARQFSSLNAIERAKVLSSLFTRSVIDDEGLGEEVSKESLAVATALVLELDGSTFVSEFLAAAVSF